LQKINIIRPINKTTVKTLLFSESTHKVNAALLVMSRHDKRPRIESTRDPAEESFAEEEFCPSDCHKLQNDVLVGAADMQRIDAAFATLCDQVDENFLVVEDVLAAAVCEKQLANLVALHRPQELVYEGNGEEGSSYTNSWRISTYAHTSPGTYVYQVFKRKYGAPYDLLVRDYMQSSGLLALLYQLKSRFLTTLGRSVGWDDATVQHRISSTFLSQLFLSVQPDKQEMTNPDTCPHTHTHTHKHTHTRSYQQEMTNLDTYLQPHYDPSVLTINLHLSPLDWQGCQTAENGLRVFSSRYPEGAKVSKKN